MPFSSAKMALKSRFTNRRASDKIDVAMMAVHLDGDQDHDFMLLMIPHHEGAIELAKVEFHYGLHLQLKAVARDIITGKTSEIAVMRKWLCKWAPDCNPNLIEKLRDRNADGT